MFIKSLNLLPGSKVRLKTSKPRLIAYYLPQFHPIAENDLWWGKGFTEWRNVAKAKPLFKGHYQPHIPADLGFYDLRVPEVREQQAELARQAGIEGFCYWNNWYAGKRILERPITEVIESGKPDFPFCIGWDNETWTGIWHNSPDRILIEQTYPGDEDNIAHFNTVLLPAFEDRRYITVDEKPLFIVFRPADLPPGLPDFFRLLSVKNGFKGIYFLGVIKNEIEAGQILSNGFDAYTISMTSGRGIINDPIKKTLIKFYGEKKAASIFQNLTKKPFHVYKYKDVLPFIDLDLKTDIEFVPAVISNWDNSPRSGINAHIWTGATPELFRQNLSKAITRVEDYPPDHKIIILKSWNEWAEGNYLEPDLRFGMGFLEAVKHELDKYL